MHALYCSFDSLYNSGFRDVLIDFFGPFFSRSAAVMASHRDCLQSVCRLCGEQRTIVVGRKPIPKEKYSRQIQLAFGLVMADEEDTMYPPFICKWCEAQLLQWWKKFGQRNIKSATCSISLFQFESSQSCDICSGSSVPISSKLGAHEAEARKSGLNTWFTEDRLRIMKMNLDADPVVLLTIFGDFSWKLSVAGVNVETEFCSFHLDSPLDASDCDKLCHIISSGAVCVGNTDFVSLVRMKSGAEGQVPLSVTPQDVFMQGSIRHKRCHLLLQDSSSNRCPVCKVHRSDLAGMSGRLKVKGCKTVSPSSHMPNRSMTPTQLIQKVGGLQNERRSLKRRNAALTEKISSIIRSEGVELGITEDFAVKKAVENVDAQMTSLLPEGTPARLLWDQQLEATKKDKQMRWHPAVIRLCIALQSKSASAYNLLRESGFIRLPHPNTLFPYSHFAEATTGFCSSMLERIFIDFKLDSCPEEERNVVVLFDEMKIKSGLVYAVKSGKIVGFTDVGDISNEVSSFERHCKGVKEPIEASHVLVFMVRGLFSSLHVPIAYYATTGVSSDQLYPCVSEVVIYLETAGLKVHALVSDGASPNRKLYKLHGSPSGDTPVYFTVNPLDPSRKLFFICDVPHLMKTTRNNWENSGFHNKTRNLVYDNQKICWTQLLHLYEGDVGLTRASPGLRRLHKLSNEHLHLAPSLRMRVYLAVQVLSSTVANALESRCLPGTSSTVKFVRLMDQFFDCLNVSRPLQGLRSRKPALEPYTSPDDWRFEWLTTVFLGFFKQWEEQVKAIPDLDKKMRKSMTLSRETVEGIRITVLSFVELAKVLLAYPGVKYILSEKLNQDPLEEYFSRQRAAGGSWDNPTLEQFGHNLHTLYVASSSAKSSKKGNVRNRSSGDTKTLDCTPLPRRKSTK